MKKKIMFLTSVILILIMAGCGKKKEDKSYLSEDTFNNMTSYNTTAYEELKDNMEIKTKKYFEYYYVNEGEDSIYAGYLNKEYFESYTTSGNTLVYKDSTWVDGSENVFAEYDKDVRSIFSYETLKDARLDEENSYLIDGKDCYEYIIDIPNIKNYFSYIKNDYEISDVTFYIDKNDFTFVYGYVMASNSTDTFFVECKAYEGTIPEMHIENVITEEEFVKESASGVADITNADIKAEIKNKTIDGYYYEDGAITNNPDYTRSWTYYENGEFISKYDKESNTLTMADGSVINGYYTMESTSSNGIKQGEINYSDMDAYNKTIRELVLNGTDEVNENVPYSRIALYVPDDLTKDQKKWYETLEEYYNNYTLKNIFYKASDDATTDLEKSVIVYLADNFDCIIEVEDNQNIYISTVLKLNKVDMNKYREYYSDIIYASNED